MTSLTLSREEEVGRDGNQRSFGRAKEMEGVGTLFVCFLFRMAKKMTSFATLIELARIAQ